MQTLWEMGERSPAKRCRFLHHGVNPKLASSYHGTPDLSKSKKLYGEVVIAV